MNTIFLSIAGNSELGLKNLQTKAVIEMEVEGLEKLIFTHIYLTMNIGLVDNSDRERKKAERIYQVAQKIGPLRQSWERRIANKLWTELCLKEILSKQKFSLATNLIFPS